MAVSTPELIVPSELVSLPGRNFSEVLAGGGPDGSDCLRVNHATGSDQFQLAQPVRGDSHWIPQGAANPVAFSFWIRRKQNFAGTGFTPSVIGATTRNGGCIMGVGNGFAQAPGADMSWMVLANGNDRIMMLYAVRYTGNQSDYFGGQSWVTLPLDEWVNIAITHPPGKGMAVDGGEIGGVVQGGYAVYRNGLSVIPPFDAYRSTSGSDYWPIPGLLEFTSPGSTQFAIGDPTDGAQGAATGSVDGPLYDIAKVTFFQQALTQGDALRLYESVTLT